MNSSHDPALFGAVLASVSRSFYLTLRVLPATLRRPVGLAYLLARASDTIADSATRTGPERLVVLRQFGQAIHGLAAIPDLALLLDGIADPAERTLLGHAGVLIELLHHTELADRDEIVRVLDEILRGQALDIERFATEAGGQIRALANGGELDAYTYSVAGCVGEFWTRICTRHLAGYSRRDAAETIQLGIAFGKGLQLVNVLRDMPADLANGRCYLPADELAAVVGNPDRGNPAPILRDRPELVRPVAARWLAQARAHLACGLRYIESVRPWRVRLACFLPWAIGVKTLVLLERTPPLETVVRVKVPRSEVRQLLFWGALAAMNNRILRVIAARFVS